MLAINCWINKIQRIILFEMLLAFLLISYYKLSPLGAGKLVSSGRKKMD